MGQAAPTAPTPGVFDGDTWTANDEERWVAMCAAVSQLSTWKETGFVDGDFEVSWHTVQRDWTATFPLHSGQMVTLQSADFRNFSLAAKSMEEYQEYQTEQRERGL